MDPPSSSAAGAAPPSCATPPREETPPRSAFAAAVSSSPKIGKAGSSSSAVMFEENDTVPPPPPPNLTVISVSSSRSRRRRGSLPTPLNQHSHRGSGGGGEKLQASAAAATAADAVMGNLFPASRRVMESSSIANFAFFRPPNPPLYDFTPHGIDEAVGRLPPWHIRGDNLLALRLPEPTHHHEALDGLLASQRPRSPRAAGSAASVAPPTLAGTIPHPQPSRGTAAPPPGAATSTHTAAAAARRNLSTRLITLANDIGEYHRLFGPPDRPIPPVVSMLRNQAAAKRPRLIFVPWDETYRPSKPGRSQPYNGSCGAFGCGAWPGDDEQQRAAANRFAPTKNGSIPCLVCPIRTATTVTLYFHGNAGDLGMISHICQATAAALNSTVIALDYPGYGVCNSTPFKDEPSEEACVAAALRVLRFVLSTTCSALESTESAGGYSLGTDEADMSSVHSASARPLSPSLSSPGAEPAPLPGENPLPFLLGASVRPRSQGSVRRPDSTLVDDDESAAEVDGVEPTTASSWVPPYRPVTLDRIILFGQSIGTGVAMQLLQLVRDGAVADIDSGRTVAAVMLHSPYASLKGIVNTATNDVTIAERMRSELSAPSVDQAAAFALLDDVENSLYPAGPPPQPTVPTESASGDDTRNATPPPTTAPPLEPPSLAVRMLFTVGSLVLRERLCSAAVIESIVKAHSLSDCQTVTETAQLVRDGVSGGSTTAATDRHHPPRPALPPFFIVHGVQDNLIAVKHALVLARCIVASPVPATPTAEPEFFNELRLPGVRLALRLHAGHNGILALEEKTAFVQQLVEPPIRRRNATADGSLECIPTAFVKAMEARAVPMAVAEAEYYVAASALRSRHDRCTALLGITGLAALLFGAVVIPVLTATNVSEGCRVVEDSYRRRTRHAGGAAARVGGTMLLWAILSLCQPSTGMHVQPPTRSMPTLVVYVLLRVCLAGLLVAGVVLGVLDGIELFAAKGPSQCIAALWTTCASISALFGLVALAYIVMITVQTH